MLLIVIARAVTLPGASEGLKFMLVPDWSLFTPKGVLNVLASAGGQMFFSLSLGMGITVTYGSYVNKTDNLQRSAVLIPLADTLAAVLAGFATLPAVFAAGLDPGQGPGMLSSENARASFVRRCLPSIRNLSEDSSSRLSPNNAKAPSVRRRFSPERELSEDLPLSLSPDRAETSSGSASACGWSPRR